MAAAASPLRAAEAPPVVSSAVASLPPPTISTTSSSIMRSRALRAWSSSSHSSSSSSSSSTTAATYGSSGLTVDCPPILSDSTSSSTTSSPASPSLPRLLHLLRQAGCIDIFYPVVILCLRPLWRPSLLFPLTMACLVVPSTLHVRYWQHWCVPSSSTSSLMRSWVWQTRCTRSHGGLDLILCIDLPPRRLPQSFFVYNTLPYALPPLAPP